METAFYMFGYFVNLLLLLILLPCVVVSNIHKITFDVFFYYFGGKVVYILLCLIVSIFTPTLMISVFILILILGYYLKKRK